MMSEIGYYIDNEAETNDTAQFQKRTSGEVEGTMNLKAFLEKESINDPESLFDYLNRNKFEWGLIVGGEKIGKLLPQEYTKIWKLKNFEEMDRDKIAICWDYATFEKNVFDALGIKNDAYMMIYNNDMENNPCHMFTVTETSDKKAKLFEYSYRRYAGLYEMESVQEIIDTQFKWFFETSEGEKLKYFDTKIYKVDTDGMYEAMNFEDMKNQVKDWEIVYERQGEKQVEV